MCSHGSRTACAVLHCVKLSEGISWGVVVGISHDHWKKSFLSFQGTNSLRDNHLCLEFFVLGWCLLQAGTLPSITGFA